MDKLKEHIRKNKDELQELLHSESPSATHRKKFLDKLDDELHPKKSWDQRTIISIAAVAAVVVISLGLFSVYFGMTQTSNEMIFSNSMPELMETEMFLQEQIDYKMQMMDHLIGEEERYQQILEDINEIDRSFVSLKNDLKQTPGDTRIINAVINNYMLKIETIDNIIYKTKNCI